MASRRILRLFLVTAMVSVAGCARRDSVNNSETATERAEVALIPRATLFASMERGLPMVSPDGERLGWLALHEGRQQFWVAPRENPDEGRVVTSGKLGFSSFVWAGTETVLLEAGASDVMRGWFAADIVTGKTWLLMAGQGSSGRLLGVDSGPESKAAFFVRRKDSDECALVYVDYRTARRWTTYVGRGWHDFVLDPNLQLAVAWRYTTDGGKEFFTYDAKTREFAANPWLQVAPEDAVGTGILWIPENRKTAFALDRRGRDTSALVSLSLTSGSGVLIADQSDRDVERVWSGASGRWPLLYSTNRLHRRWYAIGRNDVVDPAAVAAQIPGDLDFVSASADRRWWTIGSDTGQEPLTCYLYDAQTREARPLWCMRPSLVGLPWARMHVREIPSRDGLLLPSYLSLPVNVDPDGDGRPDRPLPLVLNIHGGPWARDEFGFNLVHQWLVNRGYAVLSVNYRGSSGFGKLFFHASDGLATLDGLDDLVDAALWAVDAGIADRKQIALYGGSYGGFLVLSGLINEPDLFCCGVSINGPSSLTALLAEAPPDWAQAPWYQRLGDPNTPEGQAMLEMHSPLARVAELVRPLLVVQGGKDIRVRVEQATALVERLAARHHPVTYLVFPDQGHGFDMRAWLAETAASEVFLARHLGGRAERIGAEFFRTRADVSVGADEIPGLAAALANAATLAEELTEGGDADVESTVP